MKFDRSTEQFANFRDSLGQFGTVGNQTVPHQRRFKAEQLEQFFYIKLYREYFYRELLQKPSNCAVPFHFSFPNKKSSVNAGATI